MKRLIFIILLTVIISASAGAGTVGYILDMRWSLHVEQLTTEHKADIEQLVTAHKVNIEQLAIENEEKKETLRDESYARGFWRGAYSLCYLVSYGDAVSCMRGAKAGYEAGNHLGPAPRGWDWFLIKYKGQVQ